MILAMSHSQLYCNRLQIEKIDTGVTTFCQIVTFSFKISTSPDGPNSPLLSGLLLVFTGGRPRPFLELFAKSGDALGPDQVRNLLNRVFRRTQ